MKTNKLIFNVLTLIILSVGYTSCCFKQKEKGVFTLTDESKLYIPYSGTESLTFKGNDSTMIPIVGVFNYTDFNKKFTSDKMCDYYSIETKVLQFTTKIEKNNHLMIEFFLSAAMPNEGMDVPYLTIYVYSQEYNANKSPELSNIFTSKFSLGGNLVNPCANMSDYFKCNQTITINGIIYNDVYVITDQSVTLNTDLQAKTIYYSKSAGVLRIEMAKGITYNLI
jgi:hypothetical protein